MIQVIERAAAILRALELHPEGRSLAELAAEVDLPRSTVHRIIKALEAEHLVAPVSSVGGFRLGAGLMRLGATASSWLAVQEHGRLAALSRQVDETVDLSIRSGDRVLFVDQIAVAHRLQAISGVGVAFPIWPTAPGKALLATMDHAEIAELLGAKVASRIADELAEIRRTGVAFDREEHHEGICAIGALLPNEYGLPAAVSIPVPASRFAGREPALTAALLACTA